MLAGRFRTLRTEGNQNNEVGLPLTVLRLGPEHEAAVLEMGMYVGGEIRDLAAIGRPSIGIVTAVQPVHLSRIGSIEAIEDAKARAGRGAAGRRRRRRGDPQRRRRAGGPDGRADARTRRDLRLRADADVTADEHRRRPASPGMRFRLRTPAGRARDRRSRRSAGSPSTTRWPRPPRASPPG